MRYEYMNRSIHKRSWRVFYTAPRAEMKCEERLRELRLHVFLPKLVTEKQWSDRVKKVTEPLFRSYIFARVDEKERLQVLRTPGIVHCLSFGGRLVRVPEEEIEQLKITQHNPDRLTLLGYGLPEVGEHVTVREGPMEGLEGEVIEHRGETHVVVRVQSIQQAVKVHVPAGWVVGEKFACAA